MDTERMKKAAEWFYSTIYRDEPISAPKPDKSLPSLLRTARSLENDTNRYWQSRESVFIKQAKLLVNYEDDYVCQSVGVHYFPTYQSLSDQELRGYFSWRTALRKGNLQKTALSFAFLYIYELLNQIGVKDSMDGYRKLEQFRDQYGALDDCVLPYLTRWMNDYVIYFGLDAALLSDTPQAVFDRSVAVLEDIHEQDADKVMEAVKQLSPKWLERSKFYQLYGSDMDTVTVWALRRISEHYDTRCKKGFVEQYFGERERFPVILFESAVFYDAAKKRDYEYTVDAQCVYHCKNGFWSVTKRFCPQRPNGKLTELLKTIDSVMREEFQYRHPVKREIETKWILKIIREEAQTLLAEKKAAEAKKITIDYSRLAAIRRDAAITQDKLTVEDETEEIPETAAEVPAEPSPENTTPLNPTEYRLLQCLLYGRDYGWVQAEGYMLSVLLDSINDKLYDAFMDSVLDDSPAVIADYIDDLKEMVAP